MSYSYRNCRGKLKESGQEMAREFEAIQTALESKTGTQAKESSDLIPLSESGKKGRDLVTQPYENS